MKNNKILSIVIPSYNIEKYLDLCLKSFENPKLLDLIEIMVVNDGSKDNTLMIGQKYNEMYPKSYIIIDKENGGHGSTINYGLQKATGEFFMVVDGDDWIDNDNLYKICKFLQNNHQYDAVFYDYIMELKYKNKQKLCDLTKIFEPGEIDFNKANLSITNQLGLANTIYKTQNLRKINLNLTEKAFYEDAQYMLFPMQTLNKSYYFNIPVYHYLIGRPTQSTNIKIALKRIDDRIKIIKSLISYFTDKNKFNDFTLTAYYTKTSSIINDYYALLIIGDSEYKKKIEQFEKYIYEKDKELYKYLEKTYFYIKLLRKYKYKINVKFIYKINKIYIKLKRS